MDVKFDAEKEELRQKLIIEYEARLNIFKQFKVIEAGKRLNATPFKCQACSHSFATKGKYFVLILRKKILKIKLWMFILEFQRFSESLGLFKQLSQQIFETTNIKFELSQSDA